MRSLKSIVKSAIIGLSVIIELASISIGKNNLNTIKKYPHINEIYLTSCINGGVSSTESKDVKWGDDVRLNVVAKSSFRDKQLYFSNSNNVEINGERIDPSLIKPLDLEGVIVKWYKVEPESYCYSNGGGKKFHWDKISYIETLLNERNDWTIIADAHPTNLLRDVNNGLGTMRYKAELIMDDVVLSTPGKESIDLQGIMKSVHRISFREDDSFIGWLTSFFNIPYVYGSAGRQTDDYIGADCADLVVGAYRRAGNDILYTYAGGLVEFADKIVSKKDITTDGESFYNDKNVLRYGMDVKIGDLILFGKGWHVGVIVEDRSSLFSNYNGRADGILNVYDLMIHTLFDVPGKECIGNYGRFSILRLHNYKN